MGSDDGLMAQFCLICALVTLASRLRDGLVERALESVRDPVLTVASGQDPATLIQCLARW